MIKKISLAGLYFVLAFVSMGQELSQKSYTLSNAPGEILIYEFQKVK